MPNDHLTKCTSFFQKSSWFSCNRMGAFEVRMEEQCQCLFLSIHPPFITFYPSTHFGTKGMHMLLLLQTF